MTAPKVSIGVMCYNGAKTLRRALDSVLKQDLADLEIIISDDASTDDTSDIITEYATKDSRIVVHTQKTNLGLSGNFAFVCHKATGTYFTWLGQDDFYESETYISALLKKAEQDDLDFVFPGIKKFRSDAQGQVVPLKNRSPTLDPEKSGFFNHYNMLLKSYIGYQAIYGLTHRRILGILPLWLQSYYMGKIPDEEPYCHFILSRYRYALVDSVSYSKDMTDAHLFKIGAGKQIMPTFFNWLACSGVLATAPYSTLQRCQLIAVKFARSVFVIGTLAVESLLGLFRPKRT